MKKSLFRSSLVRTYADALVFYEYVLSAAKPSNSQQPQIQP
ncbi:MAG: hypothetical protein AAF688_07245 [Bacteroidota bacterium]